MTLRPYQMQTGEARRVRVRRGAEYVVALDWFGVHVYPLASYRRIRQAQRVFWLVLGVLSAATMWAIGARWVFAWALVAAMVTQLMLVDRIIFRPGRIPGGWSGIGQQVGLGADDVEAAVRSLPVDVAARCLLVLPLAKEAADAGVDSPKVVVDAMDRIVVAAKRAEREVARQRLAVMAARLPSSIDPQDALYRPQDAPDVREPRRFACAFFLRPPRP